MSRIRLDNLTDREVDIVAKLLYYIKLYDDSNPDVGFGPNLETLLDRTGYELSQEDREKVFKKYKEEYLTNCENCRIYQL